MTHPFLICQKSEYNTLREHASQSPWKDFANEARKVVSKLTYDPAESVTRRATDVRDIMGSSALLYIIEPDNQDAHRKRITHILDQWSQFAMATYGPRGIWAAYKGEDRLEEAMQAIASVSLALFHNFNWTTNANK